MKRLLLGVLAILLLGAPTTARAATLADVDAAIPAAVTYWKIATGRTPMCTPHFDLVAGTPAGFEPGQAWAELNTCQGWIDRVELPDATRREACDLAMHEVGHMVGFNHEDPEFARFNRQPPRCSHTRKWRSKRLERVSFMKHAQPKG